MKNFLDWIGKQVRKKKKPFKSGLHVNTVEDVIEHPYIEGKKAFTFKEDDSAVACEKCFLVTKKDL